MLSINVWLLVVYCWGSNCSTAVFERFEDLKECQRVLSVIREKSYPTMQCVQAKILKPS